jgi:hypothetical protein
MAMTGSLAGIYLLFNPLAFALLGAHGGLGTEYAAAGSRGRSSRYNSAPCFSN